MTDRLIVGDGLLAAAQREHTHPQHSEPLILGGATSLFG